MLNPRSKPVANPVFIVVNGFGERKDDPESPALLALGKLLPELPCVKFFTPSRPVKHIACGVRDPPSVTEPIGEYP